MWDLTTQTAISALDALSMRSDVRAHNIANAETPGFRAQHVEFQDALRDALRQGRPDRSDPATVASPTVVDALGNSVDLETEMIGEIEDALLRQTMTAAFNFKVGNFRVSIGGQR